MAEHGTTTPGPAASLEPRDAGAHHRGHRPVELPARHPDPAAEDLGRGDPPLGLLALLLGLGVGQAARQILKHLGERLPVGVESGH